MNGKYFKASELACPCCGTLAMPQWFIDKLDALREQCGFPLTITSGYRCPKYNSRFGGKAPHESGLAVDIGINGARAHTVIREALVLEFNGIGVAQKGDRAGRFIHLDCLPAGKYPRPAVWSY